MADIFREVDEEVRRDQAAEFWKKYQNYVIAHVVVVVGAAYGWRYHEDSMRQAAEAAGARYEDALAAARADKMQDADDAFRGIIAQGPAGYAMLARFRSASDLAGTDSAKAVSVYESLANDASVDAGFRDIARLRAALLRIDVADYAEIRTRLEPLAVVGGPYRNTAREFLAIAALKASDLDAAGKWFDAIIVDHEAPAEIRGRAEALLGLVNAGKPKG